MAIRLRKTWFARLARLPEALLLQGLLTAVAHAAPGAPAAAPLLIADAGDTRLAGEQGSLLYLDLTLNGMPRGLVQFGLRDGELWASASALRQLGFILPPGVSDPVRLASLAGLQVQFDQASQAVHITAPLDMLDLSTTVLGPAGTRVPLASASTGALFNYDLYGSQGQGNSSSLGAYTELRAFSGTSVFSSTALSQTQRANGQGWQGHTVRLDTTWSRAFQDEMVSLRVGDTITSALPWSRATRIGGIQLARNFGLQPYRSTAPIPAFMGSATLPSQVELYVNGMRQYSGQVPSGPFQLNTLPNVNSSGNAQVVLTDSFGRATTLNFALFDTRQLLAQGLSDWSVDLGVVRQGYGVRSSDYGHDLASTGFWRYGVSNRFTVETHAEVTNGLALAGAGGAWQLGPWGVVSGALAYSNHRSGSGSQANLGYQWQNGRANLGGDVTGTQSDYRDVASRYGSAPAKGSGRLFAGYNTLDAGSFGLSYIYLRPRDQEATRYASAYWFKTLGRAATLNVSINQNLNKRSERTLFAGLSVALDGGVSLSSGVQHDRNHSVFTVNAQRSAPSEGGLGWRAAARNGDGQGGGQAEVDYLSRYGRVTAGASSYGDSRNAYASAAGSLVFMGGHAFAARSISDGFAVVSTDGVPDVPVHLENRLIGSTDRDGMLLVTPLHAYQNNRLAVDPMGLPPDLRIDRVDALVVPTDRAGTLAHFGMQPVRAASIVLVDAGGKPLPLGSRVRVLGQPADQHALVGFDGIVYLDNLQEQNTLRVETPSGVCAARVAHPGGRGTIPEIGPLPCTVLSTKDTP